MKVAIFALSTAFVLGVAWADHRAQIWLQRHKMPNINSNFALNYGLLTIALAGIMLLISNLQP